MMDEEQSGGQEPLIDLREYWKIIQKRRWTALSVFIAAVTCASIFTLRQQKVYEARASVIIEMDAPQVLGNVREVYNLGAGSYWSNKEYYETQYRVITSRAVAQKIVALLKLEGNKEFLGIGELPPDQQALFLQEPIDYIDLVQSALSVEPLKDSRMVFVKAKHTHPKWAMRLSNAAVNAYLKHNLQMRRNITEEAAGWLADQTLELKQRMEEAERALVQFKDEQKILSVSLEDRQNITSQALQEVSQTLNRIRTELDAMASRREQILDIKSQKLPLDSIDQVIDNPLIQRLKESHSKLQEQRAELVARYLPDHPKYKAVEDKLEVVRASIDREVDLVLAGLERAYQAKRDDELKADRRLATIKAEALEINRLELRYNQLKRVSDNSETLYQLVLKRQKEATLSSLQETNNVYKLDAAILPELPIYPRVRLNILLAALIGLLAGIALAFFLEYLDNTFKSQENIEQVLKVPFLGIIPSIKLEGEGEAASVLELRDNYLVSHPKSTVAEACRTVRTNILFMSPEQKARRILITSASPQEGKSTVCINLAIIMAQSGSRVVVVDTDMRRPRLHKSFNLDRGEGLTTAILGEADLDQVIQHSDVPGLDVIACGPIPPNPTELLHTDRFRELLNELSARYERVLLDSPPVMVVADPLILANMTDGVVLVVKSASTSHDIALRAVRQLRDVNARILGAVINDLDLARRDYGYYYYRQYGTYYGEKDRDASNRA